MALIFSDDFSSYSIGNNAVPPWEQIGLGGTVQNVGFRTKGFQFNDGGGIRHNEGGGYYSSVTIYCYFKYTNAAYNTNIIQLLNGPITNDPSVVLFRLGFENDGTLTIITAGTIMDNSGINLAYSLYPNKWYFLQATTKFTDILGFVACESRVALDGIIILDSSGAVISTQLVSLLPNPTPAVNKFEFRDLSSQSVIDEILVNSGIDAIPTYPNPGAVVNSRVSQMVLEPALLLDNSSVRMTQGIIEHARLPDDERVRITQMIIEIATTAGTVSRRGWHVKEA